eukprot:gene5376-5596_t
MSGDGYLPTRSGHDLTRVSRGLYGNSLLIRVVSGCMRSRQVACAVKFGTVPEAARQLRKSPPYHPFSVDTAMLANASYSLASPALVRSLPASFVLQRRAMSSFFDFSDEHPQRSKPKYTLWCPGTSVSDPLYGVTQDVIYYDPPPANNGTTTPAQQPEKNTT